MTSRITMNRRARVAIRPGSVRVKAVAAVCAALVLTAALPFTAAAQQVADTAFDPPVGPPTWAAGQGPHVALDEAHHDFHTLRGRYLTFGRLLARDGFVVTSDTAAFTPESLRGIDVLVVANALAAENADEAGWDLPTPSAFTTEEIAAVRSWVRQGGALLLIADHMPFPGAAHELAAAFGFELLNGFALTEGPAYPGPPMVFRRSDGSLGDSPVTDGASPDQRVDSVATFTGSAFRAPAAAMPVLVLRPGTVSLMPDTSWAFHDDTPRLDVGGWSQGAILQVGRGRVAVFGEAAMFSAQLAGAKKTPMGMNAPVASENPRLLLNLLHWLAGSG